VGDTRRDAAHVAVEVTEVITGRTLALDEACPPSCRRVWFLDVEDGGTNAADSDDNARSSLCRDRLSVDQVRGDVDEVPLADLDQLGAPRAELDRQPAAGDVGVGGVVAVVVPAGRGPPGKTAKPAQTPSWAKAWLRCMLALCSAGGFCSSCLVMTSGRSIISSGLDG
jgi:hypothetical protein